MNECSRMADVSPLLIKSLPQEGFVLLWFYPVHAGPSELMTFMMERLAILFPVQSGERNEQNLIPSYPFTATLSQDSHPAENLIFQAMGEKE